MKAVPFGTLASAATGTCEVGTIELALVTVADSAFLLGTILNVTTKSGLLFKSARAAYVARGAVIADAGQNVVQAGLAAQQAVDDPTASNILVAGAITAAILFGVGWKRKTIDVPSVGSTDDFSKFISNGKGIIANLDSAGYIEFKVNTKGSGTRGTDLFKEMMDHFGCHANGIWGKWVAGDNLLEVNRLTGNGVPLGEAIKKTWTANRAREAGFEKAVIYTHLFAGRSGRLARRG